MAEFQEVIKHWGRMLDAHRHGESIAIEASVPADAFKDAKLVEEIVMSWAAAHPEPVYPTWGEWLMQFDVMGRTCQDMPNPYFAKDKAASPIPADIAQKLGIEPKEVCQ